MNTTLKTKLKVAGKVFAYGVKKQLTNPEIVTGAAMIGLQQGLKYNGSTSRGVKAGIATAVVMSGVLGVVTVANNWKAVKNCDDVSYDEDFGLRFERTEKA